MTFEEAFEKTTGNGWLTKEEAKCLFNLVTKWCSPSHKVVEVGSHYGRSTIILAHAATNQNSEVIAIDPFEDSFFSQEGSGDERCAAFKANLEHAGVSDKVQLVRKRIEDVSYIRTGTGLIFLDGDHTTEGTRAQIEFALKCGPSVITLHDYHTKTADGQAIATVADNMLGTPNFVIDTLAVWTPRIRG